MTMGRPHQPKTSDSVFQLSLVLLCGHHRHQSDGLLCGAAGSLRRSWLGSGGTFSQPPGLPTTMPSWSTSVSR